MRMIDADEVVKYLREFRCADCDRRKGMKNGKVRFCYEIGDAPCHACDIGDTIEYFLDEDIAPTIDAIPVEWLNKRLLRECVEGDTDMIGAIIVLCNEYHVWHKEQEAR